MQKIEVFTVSDNSPEKAAEALNRRMGGINSLLRDGWEVLSQQTTPSVTPAVFDAAGKFIFAAHFYLTCTVVLYNPNAAPKKV